MVSLLLVIVGLALAVAGVASFGALALPVVLVFLGARFVRRRLLGHGEGHVPTAPRLGGRPAAVLPTGARRGCPRAEAAELRDMERRLETARRQCLEALDRRILSEMARSRVVPPLEEAHAQIKGEIDAIHAFCDRNDLAGTLRKARLSTTARDIYEQAYERDLAKVRAAIDKTEECLGAYERTVATLEVSSAEADLSSDFDSSIEMLRDLRKELPLYSLEDRV